MITSFFASISIPILIQYILVLLSFIFLGILFYSLYIHRENFNFYTLLLKEDNRVSKVGTSFIFILLMIIYQVISNREISPQLVDLLAIIFAAEIGTKYVEKKTDLSQKEIDVIKTKITTQLRNCPEDQKPANKATTTDNIDFDKL